MVIRNYSHCRQLRTSLPALRTLARVFISCLLLCLSIGSLQAQSLPSGYELEPLGDGLNGAVAAAHAGGDDIYLGFSNGVDQFHYPARLVVPDMDGDGDGVANDDDNCPLHANTDQADDDRDGIGNPCDPIFSTTLSCALKRFPLPYQSLETLSLSPDEHTLYVGSGNDSQLTRIDTRRHTLSQTTVGFSHSDVLVSRDGQRVYVANRASNTISVVDTETQETIATVSSSNDVTLSAPTALAESADGNYLFIANRLYAPNDSVAVWRKDFRLFKSIEVGSWPSALQVAGSGEKKKLYVANKYSHTVTVVSLADRDPYNWHSTQTIPVGENPHGLSLDQQGYLYVTNESSKTISVIDTETDTVISTVNLSFSPYHSHLSADGRQLYVVEGRGYGVTVIDTELARTNPSQAVLHRWPFTDSYSVDVQTLTGERRAYVSSRNGVTLLAINQVDRNGNGVGDDCDDFDGDNVSEGLDNCPGIANPYQTDFNSNGVGDACEDSDADGVNDDQDIFPADPNEWADTDRDAIGDNADNCRLVANTNQADLDGDGYGDACDVFPNDRAEWADTDGDTIGDNADKCPLIANTDQADFNGNGIGDVCEDSDNDGVNDDQDIFPTDPTEWADTDRDTIGDNADNCRFIANTDQADLDQDGGGDVCDLDIDGDGIPNDVDEFARDPSKWRNGDVAERLGDAAKQNVGQVILNIGDINGDYVDDYALGTPNFTAVINGKKVAKTGRVQIFSGLTQTELFIKTGSAAKQLLGASLASGDYNNDGVIDLAIGAPGFRKNSGQVVVCLGGVINEQWTCREKLLNHNVNGAQFGASVATQTVAGAADGLIVGAPRDISLDYLQPKGNLTELWQYSPTPKRAGSVSFYTGQILSSNQPNTAFYDRVYGAVTGGLLGASVAWLAETQQIAAGAPRVNKTGEVLLWDVANNAFDLLKGQTNGEHFGKAVAVGSLTVVSQEHNTEHLIVSAPLAANDKLKQAGRVDVFNVAACNEPAQSYFGVTKAEQLGTSLAVDDQHNLYVGSATYTVPKTANSKAIKKAGKVSRFILAASEVQAEKAGTQANQQFGASLTAIELTGDFNMDLLVGSIGANDPANKKLKAVGKLELINANDWQ